MTNNRDAGDERIRLRLAHHRLADASGQLSGGVETAGRTIDPGGEIRTVLDVPLVLLKAARIRARRECQARCDDDGDGENACGFIQRGVSCVMFSGSFERAGERC